jgi:asparagine synthase (glutamine-hydrolysing)
VDTGELLRITNHISRRGSDGKGAWQSDDGRIVLAHRRLSIFGLPALTPQTIE